MISMYFTGYPSGTGRAFLLWRRTGVVRIDTGRAPFSTVSTPAPASVVRRAEGGADSGHCDRRTRYSTGPSNLPIGLVGSTDGEHAVERHPCLARSCRWDGRCQGGARQGFQVQDVTYAPLIPSPGKIICVAPNHRGLVRGAGSTFPGTPAPRTEYASVMVGAEDDIPSALPRRRGPPPQRDPCARTVLEQVPPRDGPIRTRGGPGGGGCGLHTGDRGRHLSSGAAWILRGLR